MKWYIGNNPDKTNELTNTLERFNNFAFHESYFLNVNISHEPHQNKLTLRDQRFLKKQILENESVEVLDTALIKYNGWKLATRPNKLYISSIKVNTTFGQVGSHDTIFASLVERVKPNYLLTKPPVTLPVTTISLPIFTKDGNIAFVNRQYNCGSLCASGGIEIYKKLKDQWTFFGYASQWIS